MFSNKSGWMKVVPVVLSLSMAPGLTSCTDAELAVGLGAIAVGAGAIAIGAGASAGHDHGHGRGGRYACESGYRQVCHEHRDFHGRRRTECRSQWDSCAYRRWVSHEMVRVDSMSFLSETGAKNAEAQDSANGVTVNEVTWGETFEMGFDGSQKFLDALAQAKEGKLQPVLDLGLSRDDLLSLAKFSLPSDSGIQALAQSLDQDLEVTRAMLKRLTDIAREQAQERQLAQAS